MQDCSSSISPVIWRLPCSTTALTDTVLFVTLRLHYYTTAGLHYCTTAGVHYCTTAGLHYCTTAGLHYCTTAGLLTVLLQYSTAAGLQ